MRFRAVLILLGVVGSSLITPPFADAQTWYAVGSRFGSSTVGTVDVFSFTANNQVTNIQSTPLPQENQEIAIDPYGSFVASRDGLRINIFQVRRDHMLELTDTFQLPPETFYAIDLRTISNGAVVVAAESTTRELRSYRISPRLLIEDTGYHFPLDSIIGDIRAFHTSEVGECSIVMALERVGPISDEQLGLLHLDSDGTMTDTQVRVSLPGNLTRIPGVRPLAISPDGRLGAVAGLAGSTTVGFTFTVDSDSSLSLFGSKPLSTNSVGPFEFEFLPNLDSLVYGQPFTRARLSPLGQITGEIAQVSTNTDHYIAVAPDSLSALVNHNNSGGSSRLTVFGLPPEGGIIDPGPALFGPQLAALDTIPPRLPDGDCNGDRALNVGDIITLVNHFDNSTTITVPGYFAAADLNEDLVLEPSDFTGVQNLLLGLSSPQPPIAASPRLPVSASGDWLTPEEFRIKNSELRKEETE